MKWTEEEIKFLKENYRNYDVYFFVKYFNKTKKQVIDKAYTLKLKIYSKREEYEWTEEQIKEFVEIYPIKGKEFCMEYFHKTEAQIRSKASKLKLKQNRESEFFKEWQSRAKITKIGKKRPIQSEIMKKRGYPKHIKEWVDNNRDVISQRIKKYFKENGHPKGMLGKKHTKDFKEKMSKRIRNMWETMTEEDKDKLLLKKVETMRKNNKTWHIPQRGSWKAAWREIGGYKKFYRSRWEANYARYLEYRKQKGEVLEWQHECETFWFEGIARGCVSYLPDFKVTLADGSIEYHEVKGWMDDRSKTKIKRMAKYHPDVKLVIIDKVPYTNLENTISKEIPDWEFKK